MACSDFLLRRAITVVIVWDLLLLSCVFTGTLLVLCCTYSGTLLYISIYFAIYLHKIVAGYWITGVSSQNKRAAGAKFARLLGCS